MSAIQWSLDPNHSELRFKVKHLGISNVTGSFQVFSGNVTSSDETFSDAKVAFSADAASITTQNDSRDQHLKSADFFDVEHFQAISFETDTFNAASEKIVGTLTIKDVALPVTFDVEFDGIAKDPWGNLKAGFSFSGKIKRTDWGLAWNAALETGGVLVSEDVRIQGEVQFVKPA